MLPPDDGELTVLEQARWSLTLQAFTLAYRAAIDVETLISDVRDGVAIADQWRVKDAQKAARLGAKVRPIRGGE